MDDVLDVVAVGLGPANLGLAAAVDELTATGVPVRAAFLDRRPGFDWHPDMLLSSSVMQISFLKDLATQRDPRSPFTFTSYLHHCGRLNDFINMQTFFPSRLEFTDYLRWVVERLTVDIRWGAHVEAVDLVGDLCRVRGTRDGLAFELWSRHVVIGVGSRPVLPSWAETAGGRILHNTSLRSGLEALDLGAAPRIAVVGQGQSAAEVVRHAYDGVPGSQVHCFISGYGMVPADDSPFANRVFDPAAVDDFYFAPAAVREDLLRRHRTTNYGCVDPDLLQWLYAAEYGGRVTGDQRLHMHRASAVHAATEHEGAVTLTVEDRLAGTTRSEDFDAVVCATGFRSVLPVGMFGEGFPPGPATLARDYRVVRSGVTLPVFVVGATDSHHGLGAGLLSNIAVRSQELVTSMGLERVREPLVPVSV
ncbi:lysine N(6)-hydroxylase/L-ornithine N(5)-oxygenase family protein [Cellulomonas sp. Sa3CUA2]|uniref:L-lysine N6-monooxygenase MbtG n=1 Tax=Cellulomonas avistercoris TaxID=2762242 RepID=A0ABR8QEC7_9CELL|nr:SidA/IucD/PvdA family monooxygenase [Cellulomonas avistercoris]MBD7918784.1 lysine N(6)-hydroxylase/L-ornithine N(5)-oxygenase family protein [Cellulomonas avistercoris]